MSASNVINVVIGSGAITEGFSQDDLGRGFKLNIAPNESPFKAKIFKTNSCIVKRPQSKTEGFCEVMDSLDNVSKHMNIAGHLSVSYGPMISGEGAGKYLNNTMKTSRQSSLRFRVQHIHSYSHLLMDDKDGRVPMDDVSESFKLGDIDGDKFGTMFVDQVIWGAQLDVTFTVESEEKEDLTELMAELKGQIGIGVLSIGFKAKFEQRDQSSSRKYKMKIEASSTGINIAVPPNPSLEQVFTLIKDFNTKYEEMCKEEKNISKGNEQHTHFSPIAFVLARTEDYVPTLSSTESAFLEQQMEKVADTFKTASFWIAKLSAVLRECEAEYNTPAERETVALDHANQVNTEIAKLTQKQCECLRYRQLPLAELVGRNGTPVALVPTKYPLEGDECTNYLEGLLGNGFIRSPVRFGNVGNGFDYEGLARNDFDYEGFVIRNSDGRLQPCLSGRLLIKRGEKKAGKELVRGRTPEILAWAMHIKNHKLNPRALQTRIMSAEEYIPHKGDLFVPDDMRKILDEKNSDGHLVGPSFSGKRIVLMGSMGAGKTTLFNRLTGCKDRAEDTLETCTKTLSIANARGPAKELEVCDTPGTANSDRNGMTIEEGMELRKALINGTIAQIVVVVGFSVIKRQQGISDMLGGAINSIFDCETFKKDASGCSLGTKECNRSSPRRTRAFLVVTHRDFCQIGREKFTDLVQSLRADYPWIGPVAFIDKGVSLGWIYDTIIACSGYQTECCNNHTIPLVETFNKFKMTFKPISNEWEECIDEAEQELEIAMQCAVDKVNEIKRAREAEGNVDGNHVDHVGPTLDCITRFIDDMYEMATMKTLARCYDEPVEEIFSGTDEDENNDKVNTMNVIKQRLADKLVKARKLIFNNYPTAGEAAVYKMCPHCGAVFTKPTGCNYIGKCGGVGVKKDKGHNGTMTLQLQYDYYPDRRNLVIRKGKEGRNESFVWGMRRKLRDMASTLEIYRKYYFDNDQTPVLMDETGEWGCGEELRWDTMVSLTAKQLVDHKLVPPGREVMCEPCLGSKKMLVESFLKLCGDEYVQYKRIFRKNGLKTVEILVDLPEDEREATVSSWITSSLHKNIILDRLDRLA